MKRLLSLMLAAMMLFALVTVPAVAEATDEAATTEAITPDTTWYSEDKTEFEISTAAQLLGFVELAQTEAKFGQDAAETKKTVRLTADIDLNPGTTLRLGKGEDGKYILPEKPVNVWKGFKSWKGIFDGNGHVISGVYIAAKCNYDKKHASLFGIVSSGGCVKNLIVENSFVLTEDIISGDGQSAEGSTASGIAQRVQYGATVENLWVDMDVVTTGWTGGETAGVVGKIEDGGTNNTIRNVVFAGTVAALHTDLKQFNTSGAMGVSQILANQNWRMKASLDNVAMLGTTLCREGLNGKLPICLNAKMSEINLHAVYGKHATIEDATTAGAYWNYASTVNPDLNTEADFTYSVFAGGVIPTAVSRMLTANAIRVVGVQRHAENDAMQSLRFVAALRLSAEQLGNFKKVGFLIQIREGGADSHIVKEGTVVYTSITANGETVAATEFGSDFLAALSVTNVPIGTEIELVITPYLVGTDEVKWSGTSVSATVLANGKYATEE